MKISSKLCISQTVRARKVNFWENVHLPALCVRCYMSDVTCHMWPVTCYLSQVMCHMSHVTCHMSCVTCIVSHVTWEKSTIWWSLSVEGLLSTGPTPSNGPVQKMVQAHINMWGPLSCLVVNAIVVNHIAMDFARKPSSFLRLVWRQAGGENG